MRVAATTELEIQHAILPRDGAEKVTVADPQSYSIQSYTRASTPAYGGPDQERRAEKVQRVQVADDRRSVTLELPELRTGFVYELHVKHLAREGETFFPAEAYYTLNAIPE